jgi:hypothetical protein
VACKRLEDDTGEQLTFCHHMQTAETTWEE